ncbi:MAG TPA: pirin family protein [Acidimicrobiales bacterium]
MPAVTVADLLVLARVTRPDLATAVERPLRSLTTAPRGVEGEGFPVRRAFAGVDMAELDPFVHMDEMGSVNYGPGEPKGTPWHPHRGFETVTYIIDGTFRHRDSNGGGGLISNGDTQWMTAGAGILHIEVPPEEMIVSGGLFHGIQLWVNLPAAAKWNPPRYQDLRAAQTGLLTTHDGGALLRVVAGDLDGHVGPGSTHTPIAFVHATIEPGARLELPWSPSYNALAYVLAGSGPGVVGPKSQPIRDGQLALFGEGDYFSVTAADAGPPMELILLGGEPIREPVAWYGPFVMNSDEELKQAFDDYQHGRMGQIPAS